MAVLIVGLARACHPLPAAAVTVILTAFGWSLGWRGGALAALAVTIAVGQLSIGWSNDAFDARMDASAHRSSKPTVSGLVTPVQLWLAAYAALAIVCLLSLVVAGLVGGLFHIFAVGMAWLYNVRLSRTPWSWLPYALAFGAMPAFLSYGLNGSPPPLWTVAVFAIVAVAGHLANAVPDLETDSNVGVDGLAVRLGRRWSLFLCWALLAVGTCVLVLVTADDRPWIAAIAGATYLIALASSLLGAAAAVAFRALLVVVLVDVLSVVVAGSMAG